MSKLSYKITRFGNQKETENERQKEQRPTVGF